MGAMDWILGIAVVGGLALGVLYFTGYLGGGQRYDPKNTELFPFAPKLEEARAQVPEFLERMRKEIGNK